MAASGAILLHTVALHIRMIGPVCSLPLPGKLEYQVLAGQGIPSSFLHPAAEIAP